MLWPSTILAQKFAISWQNSFQWSRRFVPVFGNSIFGTRFLLYLIYKRTHVICSELPRWHGRLFFVCKARGPRFEPSFFQMFFSPRVQGGVENPAILKLLKVSQIEIGSPYLCCFSKKTRGSLYFLASGYRAIISLCLPSRKGKKSMITPGTGSNYLKI